MILCTLTLQGGQRQVVDYVLRVHPADAGHTLAVRAHSDTGSVDATSADDVAVTRLVVAEAQATASTPPPTGESTASGRRSRARGDRVGRADDHGARRSSASCSSPAVSGR